MGLKIRLSKPDTEVLKHITQQRLLNNGLKTLTKERSVSSRQRRIELLQKASTRTRTRGLLDETSLIRRIVVAPKAHWDFFRLLYPKHTGHHTAECCTLESSQTQYLNDLSSSRTMWFSLICLTLKTKKAASSKNN